jgi:hypothetical protein
MEPDDDPQLHQLLRQWEAPNAPPSLDDRVLDGRISWWRFLLTGQIRVPVPLGLAMVAALIAMGVFLARDRQRAAAPPPAAEAAHAIFNLKDFRPVQEVRVRIIRGHDANQ